MKELKGFEALRKQEKPNGLYPFFWQHGESHQVLGEYMEKIAGCGMKGVCIEARPHPDFAGIGWWKDLDFIMEKAKTLGMKLWILDDSHFPTGFANGRVRESYPQYLKWYLDMRRYDVHGPMRGARIDFKVLKGRFWEQPDADEKILRVCLAKRAGRGNEADDAVIPETLVDITGQMCMENRLLTLDIPAGAWSVFVVYQTRKGGEESTKDYLNPLIKEATQVLIDEVYEPHYAHYGQEFGRIIQGFFSDEPRFGNIKGTEGAIGTAMVLPWREGLERELGFEPKLLPLLWCRADGMEYDIRYRYMDTITKLYNENFTKVLGDWCKEHGVWYLGHTIEDNGAHARLGYGTGHYFRGQQDMDFAGIDVIGGQIVPGMNYHHDAFSTGGSNGEFYHYALAKLASSAAHLDARKKGRAMCEAFGAYGWNEGLKMMKWIADHLMVRGINYLVPHAFDPKEFPDFDCPPHFYAHGHNPQFRYFSRFSNYINRICGLFQGGSHPARVGVLYPAEQEWAGAYMPVEKPARILTEHQISFDIVSLDYLVEAEIEDGFYTINGQTMEVLVIPYGESLPAAAASCLSHMLAQNVRILFVDGLPRRLVGSDVEQTDLGEIFRNCQTVPLTELADTLKTFQALELSEPQPELTVGEYVRGQQRYYMLFHEGICEPIHTELRLKEEGYYYRYDAYEDRLYEAQKAMHLQLQPYESMILIVSQERLSCEPAMETEGFQEIALPKEWNVSYADSFSYPEFTKEVPIKELTCIQNVEGFESKTGTVRYTAEIEVPAYDMALLDLGEVYETAEVSVNGASAGVRICRPYSFELSGMLRPGKNELVIEVTNTLGTQMRDGISHYLVIEPFGIEGPVVLKAK